MNAFRYPWRLPTLIWTVSVTSLTSLILIQAQLTPAGATPNVQLWDSGAAFSEKIDLAKRDSWKPVPLDLFKLEADPPKASSDPGYYGREYSFRGDAVVENQKFVAVCWSAKSRVVIFSKASNSAADLSAQTNPAATEQLFEIVPANHDSSSAAFEQTQIIRNSEDEVVLKLAGKGSPASSLTINFGPREIIDVKPSPDVRSVKILGAFDYGIVPSFIGDDLIFGAESQASNQMLSIPVENMLVSLIRGEAAELVMTWPKGKQQVRLGLSEGPSGGRCIQSIDFDNDGQSFCLAPLAAAGIWHREALSASYLEKDLPIAWKPPFPAKWKTQLYEESLKTTFAFRPAKGGIWRGVPGSYDYPVWFEDGQTVYHLSKKIPPKGESLIYFLEGQGTPLSISTPVDILKSSLGRPTADALLDLEGRKLRTHHRRGGDGVHRACTCGCTEAIQAVFEAGEEVTRKEDIKGDLEDMMYFVHRHVDRINEYRRFADELSRFLQQNKSSHPELSGYIESLEQIIGRIPQEYTVQQENMKSFAYADDLVRRTMALTEKKGPNNLKDYMELLKEWRAMGGAQDYVLAQCHTITRSLAQQAGYGCASEPKAVTLAQEIRARARQCLRNPDGYEIWADY